MLANWSLILNVLLLIGVIVAIGRISKARKQGFNPEYIQPSLGTLGKTFHPVEQDQNDIISVRKIDVDPVSHEEIAVCMDSKQTAKVELETVSKTETPSTLILFLLAKDDRQFAGYELLQTILAAGLRFGEGHIFHRHQFPNGQGPVLCSLASATATGVFDLQNIGAFSVRGLCLYMHCAQNPGIDLERFAVMVDTAKQLSEGLDAHLLNSQRKPLTEEGIALYRRQLN